ncbi:glycosyltransferase family 4 protein [Alkalinema sp. FACHB-956]|uniref:glycosyltransferase family 4 protein n=1 Tax=Alkalinema sp. FACHB-956 TaxID=2692768 RepID=UPI001685C6E8|nr:glycosyltransferase family 4 protein [Alkalinema sp. FACHB-956]MBD2325250.1 glycosyltransferase family 4 protein [Alkalinema sp. FACHB-956]
MNILFLDQSGKLGGAELSLLDVAATFRHHCLVGLFADGNFRSALEDRQIPVQILTQQAVKVSKETGLISGLTSLGTLLPLVVKTANLAKQYDLIYANTQKAFVVGAIATFLSRRPLVYHLRDILSPEHFSQTNLRVVVTLANHCAALVIANSQATRDAFVQAGGRADLVQVIYNGFDADRYAQLAQLGRDRAEPWKQEIGLENHFVVGHFSRLSPWKGQHILIEAIAHCPKEIAAVLVGDALFGETEYVQQLHHQVEQLGLHDRVKFLGFQSEIPQLMASCDLVAHTSTAPEPFGRVIIEAMLCGTPIVAAAAGGAMELVNPETTGWLTSPGDEIALAHVIQTAYKSPTVMESLAKAALETAKQQFSLEEVIEKIDQSLKSLLST